MAKGRPNGADTDCSVFCLGKEEGCFPHCSETGWVKSATKANGFSLETVALRVTPTVAQSTAEETSCFLAPGNWQLRGQKVVNKSRNFYQHGYPALLSHYSHSNQEDRPPRSP